MDDDSAWLGVTSEVPWLVIEAAAPKVVQSGPGTDNAPGYAGPGDKAASSNMDVDSALLGVKSGGSWLATEADAP
jgi:hypothetical protein